MSILTAHDYESAKARDSRELFGEFKATRTFIRDAHNEGTVSNRDLKELSLYCEYIRDILIDRNFQPLFEAMHN